MRTTHTLAAPQRAGCITMYLKVNRLSTLYSLLMLGTGCLLTDRGRVGLEVDLKEAGGVEGTGGEVKEERRLQVSPPLLKKMG